MSKKILTSISLFLLLGCSSYIPEVEKNNIVEIDKIAGNTTNKVEELDFNSQKWWNIYQDENLNRVIEITLKSNTDLKIASLNIKKTKEKMSMAENEIESSLNARAMTFGTTSQSTPEIIAGDNVNVGMLTLDIGYRFDFFGKYSSLIKQQDYLIESNELYSELVQLNITTNITNMYGYYMYLNNINDLLEKEVEVLETLKISEKKKIETGMSNNDNLLSINNNILGLKNKININVATMAITKDTLNLMSSYSYREEIDKILEVAKRNQSILDKKIIIPDEISSSVISNRPDVKYYLAIINSQESKMKSLKADFYPQFSIGGNVGYLGVGINNPYQDVKALMWSLGPKVSLPLFNTHKIRNNYKIGAIDLNIFIEDYNKTINKSYSNIEESLTNLKVAKKNTSNSNESLKNSSTIIEHSNINYKIGIISKDRNIMDKLSYINEQLKNENEKYKLYSRQIVFINSIGGVYKEN